MLIFLDRSPAELALVLQEHGTQAQQAEIDRKYARLSEIHLDRSNRKLPSSLSVVEVRFALERQRGG